MTTRDALDSLMVAHDALIEGRSAGDVMRDAPLWARADRQLPRSPWVSYPNTLRYDSVVIYYPASIIYTEGI